MRLLRFVRLYRVGHSRHFAWKLSRLSDGEYNTLAIKATLWERRQK